MTNRLADATSPYLLQHKDNPVDWWEWSDEAFAEARRRDVPVFLSIGYAACHWCHVMAHESFDDEAAAAYLNEHFVSIKVDREERPDVDAVYMAAVTGLTGHGGWPMTVFLNNKREPFHAGTYFPPLPRHGTVSFTQLLAAISDAWTTRRDDVDKGAAELTEALRKQSDAQSVAPTTSKNHRNTAATHTYPYSGSYTGGAAAVDALERDYDQVNGGFGGAPKFPPSAVLEFLLRHHARTGDDRAMRMVEGTCEAMSRGGMYDQLAGGFSRYSVDAHWTVPHFEKMLYDNAQLLSVYTNWYRATGSNLAAQIAYETAAFLLNDLRTPEGGFASALDADAPTEPGGPSHEGSSYVWTPEQLIEVLGPEDGVWAIDVFDVSEAGTFENATSVLTLRQDPPREWTPIREKLLVSRNSRPQPARDDKVVAAWNGLAIAALAQAGALLDEPDWIDAARDSAALLVDVHFHSSDGGTRLTRVSRDGVAARHAAGVLEDYADVAHGLLALAAVTGEQRWREAAGELLATVVDQFGDGNGGFFDTPADGEQLVVRPRELADLAAPSGWSGAIGALLNYGTLMASPRYLRAAEVGLERALDFARRAPRFAGWTLAVAEAAADGPRVAIIVGDRDDPRRGALHRHALRATTPGLVIAVGDDSMTAAQGPFNGRGTVAGNAVAYVCHGSVCAAPVTTPREMLELLEAQSSHP